MVLLWTSVGVSVCINVCLPPRLLIICGVIQTSYGIKWKERKERRFKLEAPKIVSVSSPQQTLLLLQTRSDVILVQQLFSIANSNILQCIIIIQCFCHRQYILHGEYTIYASANSPQLQSRDQLEYELKIVEFVAVVFLQLFLKCPVMMDLVSCHLE